LINILFRERSIMKMQAIPSELGSQTVPEVPEERVRSFTRIEIATKGKEWNIAGQ
jgi:hypothetical protein